VTSIPLNFWSDSDRKAIREQLGRILGSAPFLQSRRRQRFLEYIIDETLAGRGGRLKGYTIGLEVFARPATFDPVADPIVRIEAVRLREKLRQYYTSVGRSDPIRISLPKGTYTPQIAFRQATEFSAWLERESNRANGARFGSSSAALMGLYGTRDIDSHNELLAGLKRFWVYTREACGQAQQHFAQAIDLDREHATAHAWLARTHIWQFCMNWCPDAASGILTAGEHARRAVELDDKLPLAHSILGKIHLYQKDSENAVIEGYRACALDPISAEAKMFLSFILAATGHGSAALSTIETAMLLQPHPSSYYFETLGLCHFARGDYDRAISAFLSGIELNPSYMPARYELAITYGVCGRVDEAQAEASIVKADWPDVAADFFVEPRLADIYLRGKQVAGLA
jgi:Tfp pilus assembly protein PilF